MKRIVLTGFFMASLFTMVFTSCKDQGKEVTASEAQDVAATSEEAVTYTVDTTSSTILWTGSKPTGTHKGSVKFQSGEIAMVNGSIEAGNFTIDMNTITDHDLEGEMKGNLEAHLKGTVEGKEGDFFNVTKYPTATFELTEITEVKDNVQVSGNLTIKEKTHNIKFPAMVITDGNTLTLKSEPFTIDRTQWDVNFKSKSVFDNLGDKFIDDEIGLTIKVVANKK